MSTSLRLRYAAQDAILASVLGAAQRSEPTDRELAEAIYAEGEKLAEKWQVRDWLKKTPTP